jgi:hypothetical protein
MKRLFVLMMAASAIVTACGDDDDSTGGVGGRSSAGNGGSSAGESEAGSGGSSVGKAGSSSIAGTMAGGEGGTSAMGVDGGAAGEKSAAGMAGDGGSGSELFTVTLENIASVKAYTSSGVFNTPVGDATPGPLTPGKKYEFTIEAGRKQKLSFATMLAATNDLFFGPDGDGIALYDNNGDPITGFVTDQISLWDAGTEVNEEPKVGANTVSKQAAPNTGPAENGNVVDIADTTDTFDYPSAADVMTVQVTHMTGTQFKVTISNVSSDTALMTSGGNFPAPLSPGVWVVHNGKDALFTEGTPDRGKGLEHLAEDGNVTDLAAYAAGTSGITFPASPGVFVVHDAGTMPLFTAGVADYAKGLEHIAEDGNPAQLVGNLSQLSGYVSGAVFNMPVGSAAPGPVLPGSKYSFSFRASPGQALSFATMLAATNDVFFGPAATGIPLFDEDGQPVSGDVSAQVSLWDLGSEANERPGIGPNTVTNQPAPDTGSGGEGKVQLLGDVNDGFTYPASAAVLKVTIQSGE